MALRDMRGMGDPDSKGLINIDDVLDVYHGVKNIGTEEEDNTEEEIIECEPSKCGSCPKSCKSKNENPETENKPKFSWDKILYGIDEDDEDDTYICEYCTRIGYAEKYDPDLCNDCNDCEGCAEYGEECDGCSYSYHRDGSYYSEKLDMADLMSERDMELLESAKRELNQEDIEWRGSEYLFSTLDI